MKLLVVVVALLLGCGDDAGGDAEMPLGGQGGAGGDSGAERIDASPGMPSDAGLDGALPIACADSLDCPIGRVCDTAARVCVECTRASDCEADHVCVDRACQLRCDSDLDCQALRMLCDHQAGHCVRELAQPDAGTDGAVECSGTELFGVARVPPTVILVVDGSTSMEIEYGEPVLLDSGVPDPEQPLPPSRWHALREALVGPEGLVPALAGAVRFGLGVFGTTPACPLPLGIIEPAIDNGAAIAGGLAAAPPGLFTPTGAALDTVIDALPDSILEPARGKQVIVLATDGDPNSCEAAQDPFMGTVTTDYAPSLAAATKARAKNIELLVISLGQDASIAHLQEVANLGAGLAADAAPGARLYVPEDAADLTAELRALVQAQLGCDLQLDLEGRAILEDKACSGQLTINGTAVPCGTSNGWSFVAPATIRLESEACALLDGSTVSAAVTFPCDALAR